MPIDKRTVAGATTGGTLLKLIRESETITRAELVRLTGLSKSTVSLQVDRLLRMHLVREERRPTELGPGRRNVLRFASDRGVVLGIELGATSVDVALCDLDAAVITAHSEPLEVGRGPRIVLDRIYDIADKLLDSQPHDARPLVGVGMGLPGPVDLAHGCVISPPIMPGWDRFPVRDEVSAHFAVPCYVDNDVNVMAIGEARAGDGRALRNFLFVKIGTGIGCGIIVDRRIYRGAQGSAGDIGHIALDGQTERCPCGNQGCLEVVAGGAAIARRGAVLAESGTSVALQELARKGAVSAVEVGQAAAAGDAPAIDLVVASGHHIGTVLAKLVNFFNPEMIVLGGGVTQLGAVFVAAIREMVVSRSTALATADLSIRNSTFGEAAGMVGAAAMAVEELYSIDQISKLVSEFVG